MINSIEEYLDLLRQELAGSDQATVEKALEESEEHLRTALESGADLQSVIEEYGSPEELAANYREPEGKTPPEAVMAEMTEAAVAKPATPRRYSVGWIIAGSIIVFFSCIFAVSGGGILIARGFLNDEEGYLVTDSVRIDRDTYAIISETAEINPSASRFFKSGFVDLKIDAEAVDPGANVFIGVAQEMDIARYLTNVPHEKLTEYKFWSADTSYENVPGSVSPASPTSQTFWEQSVHGAGIQTLSWEPRAGRWVIVLMNEDGTRGIDVDVKVGARFPWLFGIGLGLLLAGLAGLTIGILLIIFPGRKRSAT